MNLDAVDLTLFVLRGIVIGLVAARVILLLDPVGGDWIIAGIATGILVGTEAIRMGYRGTH